MLAQRRRLFTMVVLMAAAVLTAFAPGVAAESRTCYFPNGNVSPQDRPCYSGSGTSFCCQDGGVCLQNGLCFSQTQPYTLSRGSCTDKSWGAGCPSQCVSSAPDSGIAIIPYDSSSYCCGLLQNNLNITKEGECGDGTTPFKLHNSYVFNNTDSSKTGASSASSQSSRDVAIGVGVGIPLGLIAIAALTWAMWERMIGRRHAVANATTAATSTGPGSAISRPDAKFAAPSTVPGSEYVAIHSQAEVKGGNHPQRTELLGNEMHELEDQMHELSGSPGE